MFDDRHTSSQIISRSFNLPLSPSSSAPLTHHRKQRSFHPPAELSNKTSYEASPLLSASLGVCCCGSTTTSGQKKRARWVRCLTVGTECADHTSTAGSGSMMEARPTSSCWGKIQRLNSKPECLKDVRQVSVFLLQVSPLSSGEPGEPIRTVAAAAKQPMKPNSGETNSRKRHLMNISSSLQQNLYLNDATKPRWTAGISFST